MKSYVIKFVKGVLFGEEFPIGVTPVSVGRSRGCDIRIPSELVSQDVSRTHVMLVNQEGVLQVVNMSSRKTLVNGTELPLNHKATLAPGMCVTMGASTEFRVLETGDTAFATKEASRAEKRSPAGGTLATVCGDAAFVNQLTAETRVPAGGTQATVCGDAAVVGQVTAMTAAPMNNTDNGQTGELNAPMTGMLEDENGADDAEAALFVADEQEPAVPEKPDMPETGTIAGETVMVSPDELGMLIEANRKAKLFKSYKKVGLFLGGFIVLAIAYLSMRPNPETNLTWPRRGDGMFDDKKILFQTALGENAVGVLCPYDSRIRVRESSNDVTVVDTFIGRDRDVPLRLKFVCEKNQDFLKKSRNQLFDEKRRSLEEAGGWNFLAVSPVAFLGSNNGIPYRGVQYLRSEKTASETMNWFGHLMFAVHGDCALTFTREIPAVEQWRGGRFLARETMLLFGEQIIDGHWEGRSDCRDDPLDVLLAEADGLLSLHSPLLWKESEYLLQSVMIKSGGTGKHFDEAQKRLVQLRKDQRIEYNRLKALANQEKSFNKSALNASPALEEALRVFSSPDDKRNVLLRKGRWL